jgi:hypothetical protein
MVENGLIKKALAVTRANFLKWSKFCVLEGWSKKVQNYFLTFNALHYFFLIFSKNCPFIKNGEKQTNKNSSGS